MWTDEKKKAPIADFLGWLLFITVFFKLLCLFSNLYRLVMRRQES